MNAFITRFRAVLHRVTVLLLVMVGVMCVGEILLNLAVPIMPPSITWSLDILIGLAILLAVLISIGGLHGPGGAQ